MEKIVKCRTERQDGSRCGFMLQPIFKVCPLCEKKVDPAWFSESLSPDVEAPNTGGSTRQEANTSPDENGNSRTNNGGTPDGSSHTNNGGTSDSGNPVTQSVIGETSVDDAGLFAESNGKRNGATNGTQTNGSPKPNQRTTKVGFRAFLAPTVDFNPKKDQLFVVFGPERDNWDCKLEGRMKFPDHKRKKNNPGLRVFAEIELEKELLKNGLSYRYCFQKRSSDRVSIENEFLFQQYYPFHNSQRIIKIPPDTDSYQQYDGYIYAKKGGYVVNLFKSVLGLSNSNMIETMKSDGEFALRNYLPDIKKILEMPNQDPSMMMEAFNDYTQVFKGGIKHHFMVYRSMYDPKIWQETLKRTTTPPKR